MALYTTTTLLNLVKQKAALTKGLVGLNDSDIIAILTRRMQSDVVSAIKLQGQEYLQRDDLIPLVSYQTSYPIPYRAVAGVIDTIFMQWSGTSRNELKKRYANDLSRLPPNYLQSIPCLYIIEDNAIRFFPDVGSVPANSFIDVFYMVNPSALVPEIQCRQVASIDPTQTIFGVNSVPLNFTTSVLYDFVSNSSNSLINYDQTVTNIDPIANEITFATSQDGISIGDWLCVANTSCVPMVPSAWIELLASFATYDIQQIRQDQMGMEISQAEIKRLTAAINILTDSRVESDPDKFRINLPFGRRW